MKWLREFWSRLRNLRNGDYCTHTWTELGDESAIEWLRLEPGNHYGRCGLCKKEFGDRSGQ